MPNTFGKPWGLQADGDLWQQAWLAVLARGPGKQALTKVKGHATQAQVEEGAVREADKVGNDWGDSYVERGARQQLNSRYGEVAFDVKWMLAAWLHKRQRRYVDFVHKVQKMIGAVIKAEQDERERRKRVETLAAGYDKAKECRFTFTLYMPGSEELFQRLHMLPPIEGKHRYGGVQQNILRGSPQLLGAP